MVQHRSTLSMMTVCVCVCVCFSVLVCACVLSCDFLYLCVYDIIAPTYDNIYFVWCVCLSVFKHLSMYVPLYVPTCMYEKCVLISLFHS